MRNEKSMTMAQHWLQWAQDEESKGSKKDANAEGNEV
jgi:hypothetical protein